jgi:hypothetical protein
MVDKEVKVFGALPSFVEDLNGNKIEVKKINLRKECQIFRILDEVASISPDSISSVAKIPEVYTKLGAIILDIPEEEVLDRFDLATIRSVVDPFLQKYAAEANKPLGGVPEAPSPGSSPSSPGTVDGTQRLS